MPSIAKVKGTMCRVVNFQRVILLLWILCLHTWTMGRQDSMQCLWLQPAQAESVQVQTKLPVSKTISQKALEKYSSISVTVEEDGKAVKYSGVPLRTLLAEMVPELKLETMPGW